MSPKKTKQAESFDEPVIPEGAVDFASALIEKHREPNYPVLDIAPRLIAYAAFEVDGEQYEAGDEFTPRKSWQRDDAFVEFRSVELKKGGAVGIAFLVPGAIVDKKTQERQTNRIVLPLKEA